MPHPDSRHSSSSRSRSRQQRAEEFDERYNDPEFLQEETRNTQQKSVQSSRRALNRLNDAQQIAADNLNRMNEQSEQLYKMEHDLEETKHTAKVNVLIHNIGKRRKGRCIKIA